MNNHVSAALLSTKKQYRQHLAVICIVLCVTFGCFFTTSPVHAGISDTGIADTETIATNPKSRTVTVTANVRDHIAPSVPILVLPVNNAILNQNIFTFVWKSSADDQGLLKYQLFLDGLVYQDNIATTTLTTNEYIYEEHSGTSSMILKGPISDGTHTWKIRVWDVNGNYADSVTWTFTINTTKPVLVITNIGEIEVSISSQDTSTIPSEPIEITQNGPTITGKTDPNATVRVSITINADPEHGVEAFTFTTTITANSSGIFTVTLPTLPKDTLINLQITAENTAGNISIIDGVRIRIITKFIALPSPLPKIPIIPQEEIEQKVEEKIIEIIEQIAPAPLPQKQLELIQIALDYVVPVINVVFGVIVFLMRVVAIFSLLGIPTASLSASLLFAIFNTLWLFPLAEKRGQVVDQRTKKGIPFALLSLYRTTPALAPIRCIADSQGHLPKPPLPNLPTIQLMQEILAIELTRKGYETLTNLSLDTVMKAPQLVIPMKPIEDEKPGKFGELKKFGRSQRSFAVTQTVAVFPTPLLFLMVIGMTATAFVWLTPWNVAMAALYAVAFGKRVVRRMTGR